MALKVADLDKIARVTIPQVRAIDDRGSSFVRRHLTEGCETQTCTVVSFTERNGNVSQLTLSLSSGSTLQIRKTIPKTYSDEISHVLKMSDLELSDGTLSLLSARPNWLKHPALNQSKLDDIADDARSSWESGPTFVAERRSTDGTPINDGLRPAQIGALHAVAAHWIVSSKPALVVMPTGTGKTEVMLACMVMCRPQRLLVLVPSDALRSQTFDKFTTLGLLPKIGVLAPSIKRPVVGMIRTAPRSVEDIRLIKTCNVVVSTVAALNNLKPVELTRFLKAFDTVFFDEAHHVPATSWTRISSHLASHNVLLFTATPFRLDGVRIPGRIIYSFPLRLAQQQQYFRRIRFLNVFETDQNDADVKIAEVAVGQLRKDLAAGLNHYLLARANTIARAETLLSTIYAASYGDLNPVVIHSKMRGHSERLDAIKAGQHRIIVCVDMFGEGFDFPGLKVAALHDPHCSLAITLQFTGRFTREAKDIGDASLVANTADPKVSDSIEELFAEDSDWNELIPDLSGRAIQSEMNFSDFLERMEGDVADEDLFGLNVLRPKTSTVIFKVKSFKPARFEKALRRGIKVERVWKSKDRDLLVVITRTKVPIEWATIKETANDVWDLFVLAHDPMRGILFIYSSQKQSLHQDLAKAVSGDDATLLSGEQMFRAMHGISRLVFHNAGLYRRGARLSFRMYSGLDIGEAIDPTDQTNSTKSNLFAVGYEDGQRVSIGVSHKGRIWSMSSDSIPDWRQWCDHMATKILDDSIPTNEYLAHTLRPKLVARFPESKRLLTVSMPAEWYASDMQKCRLYEGLSEIDSHSFEIQSFESQQDGTVQLTLRFGDESETAFVLKWGPSEGDFNVAQKSGKSLYWQKSSAPKRRLDEYLKENPPALIFVDGSELIGPMLLDTRRALPFTFDMNRVTALDWSGVDIRVESKWKNGVLRNNSVQSKLIDVLVLRNNQFVIDDDDSGEVADVIEITIRSDEVLICLYHCKFSGGDDPGERVKDLYEVCCQAARSVRWTYDMENFLRHILEREKASGLRGRPTRFEKGTLQKLANMRRRIRRLRVRFEVFVVQPGVSKASIHPEMPTVLGATSAYINEITGTPLTVISSS